MKTISHLLFIALILLFTASCNGQYNAPAIPHNQPRLITTLGANNYDNVGCGLQDKAGNLWFGTSSEGVYKYDGRSFINFTEKDGLCNNAVSCIMEDKDSNIWFGTKTGICRYDGKTFTNISRLGTDKSGLSYISGSLSNSLTAVLEVRAMLQDRTGKIWIGTGDGVYCYSGNSLSRLLDHDGVANKDGVRLKAITSILEDKDGHIWFTSWFDGICCYDGKSIVSYRPFGKVWFAAIFQDKAGNLWVGTRDNGAYRCDKNDVDKGNINFTKLPHADTFSTGSVCSIAEDNDGNMWFTTEAGDITKRELMGGVWRYDGRSFKNYTVADGLSHNSVFSITKDRSGKLWFGTRNTGLCSYDGRTFTDYADRICKNIRSIFEDKTGSIWLATNGDGICKYTVTGGTATFTHFNTQNGFAATDVRCITEDRNGNIWLGTNMGLYSYNGKQFTNYTVKDGLPDNNVWSVLADKTGTIWVGTSGGACRYNTAVTPAFTILPIPPATEEDFSRPVSGNRIIWDIKEDRAGNIWLATNGSGVYRYNKNDPLHLTHISQKDGLCSNFVNCILEDRKGTIWMATQHGGVSRYNPSATSGSAIITTSTTQGLCGNEIWTMLEDKEGNIWFAVRNSLCRYNGTSFTNFGVQEGLLAKNKIQDIFEDKKGTIWLGSSGGLFRFNGKSFINLTANWTLGSAL